MMFAFCGRAILTEFRLREIAFGIIAARYRFLGPSHKNALAALCRLLGSKRDHSILTPEAGTGTRILRLLMFPALLFRAQNIVNCPALSLTLAPRTGTQLKPR
jgi:hypothetical protein